MIQFFSVLALAWALMTSGAQAQDNPVVVELFTSQGCSSCPPADALLARLGQHDDVIALALHIDYWDYIGWKDKFAQPGFTKRQKGYAHAAARKMIYTPQMVINGQDEVAGNRPMDVTDLIQRHRSQPRHVAIDLARSGNRLVVRLRPERDVAASDVFMVRYTPDMDVAINRGENAGLQTTYTHIVTDWTRLAQWDGKSTIEVTTDITGPAPVVVLVQKRGYGPIFAAARLR